ncbi:MAG: hypothetical protein N5P05_001691 [Chroococcopsis gigantea SAG 12.99]|nr:hypothetical protein [Chroococcopsis gigantea SAG 12.99]
MSQWFENRTAVLATMHGKERAIAPPLRSSLKLEVIVPENFNTDVFGTFTREIKRPDTQLETARRKALKAMEITGNSIGIASEGSFYPYPGLPLLSCDREIVLLIDKVNDLEIIGETISTDTNHHHQSITSVAQALEFARKVGFPRQGLVVMLTKDATEREDIFKGITGEENLIEVVKSFLDKSPHKSIHIETDLRAMLNPSRMKAIEAATLDLIQKINRPCPMCHRPGFEVKERIKGLPCKLCHAPTELVRAEVYSCSGCDYREEKAFPRGDTSADPMYCNYCNP